MYPRIEFFCRNVRWWLSYRIHRCPLSLNRCNLNQRISFQHMLDSLSPIFSMFDRDYRSLLSMVRPRILLPSLSHCAQSMYATMWYLEKREKRKENKPENYRKSHIVHCIKWYRLGSIFFLPRVELSGETNNNQQQQNTQKRNVKCPRFLVSGYRASHFAKCSETINSNVEANLLIQLNMINILLAIDAYNH